MKIDWNKKYLTIAFYSLMVILFAVCAVFAGVYWGRIWGWFKNIYEIMKPVVYGLVLAFLFAPVYKLFYFKVYAKVGRKKGKTKLRRALSIIYTYLSVIVVITIVIMIIIPQVGESYSNLESRMGDHLKTAQGWLEGLVEPSAFFKEQYEKVIGYLQELLQNSYEYLQNITPLMISFLGGFVTEAKNIILGLIISVYFLLSKERFIFQLKRILKAFSSEGFYESAVGGAKYASGVFSEFLSGKILDSMVIGLLCFVIMTIIQMPYAPLVSVIIAVMNIIPFIGIFMGALPGLFIIFISSPSKAIWFVIMVIVIQQLDNHFIEPYMVKTRTDISVMWMIISVIVMGGLFGILAMFIAVPLFVVLNTFVKELIGKRLEKKGLPPDEKEWINKD